MKLPGQTFGLKLAKNGVNAVGHDERRSFGAFCQEIAHRAIERPRHADRLTVAREQRERTVNSPHSFRIAREHTSPRFVYAEVVDLV
jgi:hypothetical protein